MRHACGRKEEEDGDCYVAATARIACGMGRKGMKVMGLKGPRGITWVQLTREERGMSWRSDCGTMA